MANNNDPLLEMFIFETNELLEQLVEILIESEKENIISEEYINEIFRIMHTIKGSSAMLAYNSISTAAHVVEDLFFLIREHKPKNIDYSAICDVVLSASDFIKRQMVKVESGEEIDGAADANLIRNIEEIIKGIKKIIDSGEESSDDNKFIAKVFFEDDCKMENIRAFSVTNAIKEFCSELYTNPPNLLDDDTSSEVIIQNGFVLYFSTQLSKDEVQNLIKRELFVKTISIQHVESFKNEISEFLSNENNDDIDSDFSSDKEQGQEKEQEQVKTAQGNNSSLNTRNNFFNVHVSKLDMLMNLVGEIVIAETMIAKNPDLQSEAVKALKLENLSKSLRQFRKLTDELQDIVMSLRMVPIAATFNKMHRIVRDMCKKMNKEADLILIGEDIEVDKGIVDSLGDPLMHIVRNSMDHGIEDVETRLENGKNRKGRVILEAKNTGEEVVIKISDDGKGLDKDVILAKARANNLVGKSDVHLSDTDVYNLILLPGFSTKEEVSEFSGRGVGMDVVKKNIEKVGGTVSIDSAYKKGSTITIKIPLTLAIIDGMEISVGGITFTLTTTSIIRIFKPIMSDVVIGSDDREMIVLGDECLPVIRLSRLFNIKSKVEDLSDGILLLIESDSKSACIFADELLGEQQVVVKPLPKYVAKYPVANCGVAGCTIMGDGSISLILDATRIINNEI